MEDYLYHHGILGMKWGIRKYQNEDGTWTEAGLKRRRNNNYKSTNYIKKGGTLKKGSVLYRIGAEEGDPTALNRKYFSTSIPDHRKWMSALFYQNMEYGGASDLRYVTTDKIKIASNTKAGKEFVNMLSKKDDQSLEIAYKEIEEAFSHYPPKVPKSASKEDRAGNIATALIAAQTETGKEFVNHMLNSGYGGVGDVNGTDISKDPIIIFDPDKKTKKTYENYISG